VLLFNIIFLHKNFILVFGRFCGPTVTSLIFYLGGPLTAFLFSSFTISICFIITYYFIDLNEEDEIKQSDHKETFFTSFEKFDIFMLFLSQLLNVISKQFYGPLIFNHISNKFNISLENASNLVSLSFLTYCIAVYFIDDIIKNFGTKLSIAVGLFINFFSVVLLSPIEILPQ